MQQVGRGYGREACRQEEGCAHMEESLGTGTERGHSYGGTDEGHVNMGARDGIQTQEVKHTHSSKKQGQARMGLGPV